MFSLQMWLPTVPVTLWCCPCSTCDHSPMFLILSQISPQPSIETSVSITKSVRILFLLTRLILLDHQSNSNWPPKSAWLTSWMDFCRARFLNHCSSWYCNGARNMLLSVLKHLIIITFPVWWGCTNPVDCISLSGILNHFAVGPIKLPKRFLKGI